MLKIRRTFHFKGEFFNITTTLFDDRSLQERCDIFKINQNFFGQEFFIDLGGAFKNMGAFFLDLDFEARESLFEDVGGIFNISVVFSSTVPFDYLGNIF